MKDCDRAYAAGLMDADGSISIFKTEVEGGRPRFQVRVNLEGREAVLPKWLASKLGGKVHLYIYPRQGFAAKTRRYHHWHLYGKKAQAFLRDIEPYLVLKREQAQTALAFPIGRSGGGGNRGLTPEDHKLREEMYQRMKILHKYSKGPK